MELALSGLLIITLAWVIQAIFMMKGRKEIQPAFVAVYMMGVIFLAYDGYVSGSDGYLIDFMSFVVAGIVLIMSTPMKKKR